MSLTTRMASVAASAAIAIAALGVAAQADEVSTTHPCAQQQAQVDKATVALARVTAVFARQKERVETAKEVVAAAAAGQEKAAAKRALADAKHDKADTKVTKRAQQQRLAKATERLSACQAEPPATEAPA